MDVKRKTSIKRATKTSNGAGGFEFQYTVILETFASIKDKKVSVKQQDGQYKVENVKLMKIPTRSGFEPKRTDLVIWDEDEYSITDLVKKDDLKTRLEYWELTLTRIYGQD